MKTKSLLVAVALLLLACQPKKETESEMVFECNTLDLRDSEPACAMPAPINETVKFVPPVIKDDAVEENSQANASKNIESKNKKIIKDGSISIKVKAVEASKKRMDAIVALHHGYYENESYDNSYENISYTLKVRVPSKQFESFLKASENCEGVITNKNINARDVTEEYMDGETRLSSKRLFRNRYNQLLEKAFKVDDIMAIEEKIRALQEEIESQEGHLKFLDDQVTYSTLEINLFCEKDITKPTIIKETFLSRTKTSLSNGWEMLVSFVLGCVMAWPWFIVIIAVFVMITRFIKRRKK